MTTPNQTKPPLELSVEIEAHDGTLFTWDANARKAANRPQGLSFQTQRGEGFGPSAALLTRPVMKDYADLSLLDSIRFIGKNGEVAYDGRIHDFSRTNDPMQQFAITGIGWMNTLKFRTMNEIYIDRDLGNWGEPSLARQAELFAASFSRQANMSVAAGGISFDLTGVAKTSGAPFPGGEAWYFGGGVDIGRVFFDQHGDATTTWIKNAGVSIDGLRTGAELSASYNGVAESLLQAAPEIGTAVAGMKYAFFQTFYTVGGPFTMSNLQRFVNIAVIGRHGLTLYGEAPEQGLVVSDMLEHIVSNFSRLTWAGEATAYPVQQAAFHGITPYEAIQSLNDIHLFETNVFEERKFLYYPADLTQADWQVRTDDPGVRFDPLQGDSIDSFANGVEVTWTDFSGVTRTIYPNENAELRDETESNPANLHGDDLWTQFTVPYPTVEADALQMGRAYLAEFNRRKAPGTITIQGGYLKDSAEHWCQGWRVRNGETIALTDHPDDAPRLITTTSWDQDSKTLTVSVDNGYQLLSAFLARMANAREGMNLT